MLNDDIIRIIEEGLNDQSALLEKLEALGHKITQSSISRKLKALGINKIHGKYQKSTNSFNIATKISFTPPNMIVIRTSPGNAGSIAAKIDQQLIDKYPEFIGSIAGDDTIFLAVNLNGKNSDYLIRKLKEII